MVRVLFALLFVLLTAGLVSAEYLGDYAIGDSVTLRAVINDNGTVADSVSGDSVKAVIYWQETAVDTVVGGLTQMGTGNPWSGLFTKTIYVDTAGGGFGSWYALLWAVNVDIGTRDPAGLFP